MTSNFQADTDQPIRSPRTLVSTATRRGLALLSLPAVILFAGCSNKPETSDVQHALSAEYDCPVVEVRDVEKLNGEPGVIDRRNPATRDRHLPATGACAEGRLERPRWGRHSAAF